MIEICGVSKKIWQREILRNVTFSIADRELITLLGPNGAGKTTLMRLLCGYWMPDAGYVSFNGKTFDNNRLEILQTIGYMPENVPLYPEMTVGEYLRFVGEVYKMPVDRFEHMLKQTVIELEIGSVLAQKTRSLSKGYKRRVALAAAVIHQPGVLILDEPTEGMDPNQKIVVRRFLQRYAEKNAVLISTHLLEEAEALDSRVLMLAGGRLICDTTVDGLRRHSADGTLPDAFFRLTHSQQEEV